MEYLYSMNVHRCSCGSLNHVSESERALVIICDHKLLLGIFTLIYETKAKIGAITWGICIVICCRENIY